MTVSKRKQKFKALLNKDLPAFTLTELLVVLVIVGILVLLALPSLMPLITKAKSTEAKLQLEHLFTLEKTYYYQHSKYATDFNELGYEQVKTVVENGNANYKVEVISAAVNTFKARATAVVDFDGDGTFNVWEVDEQKNIKEVVQD